MKDDSFNHQSGARAVRLAKSDPLMFGSSLADVFSAPAYDCRVLGQEQKPEFAVTRLCSGPREMEKAPPYPADNSILICVSLTPSAVGQWRARYDGREIMPININDPGSTGLQPGRRTDETPKHALDDKLEAVSVEHSVAA